MDLLRDIFKGDRAIWMIFLLLCVVSILEVFSAASTLTYSSGDHWEPITKHSVFLLVGVVVVIAVHNIPYKYFKVLPFFLLPISMVLLLVVALTSGHVNNASRWLSFFGIQFQPSELAKLANIVATALVLSTNLDETTGRPKTIAFKRIMIMTGVLFVLIAPENASTGLLLAGVVYVLMIIGRVATHLLIKTAVIATFLITLFGSFIAFVPPRAYENIPMTHRFVTWHNRVAEFFVSHEKIPAEKYDFDKNGQVGHAHIAIATSHIIGKMPGNSVERDFLSQAYSDFIYAIIIEELGLIGGAFVVILYLWLLVRTAKIAKRCQSRFATLLVIGIALMFVMQALLNMMVAVGLFPVTGQPLPLISKGGTSTIVNCVYIGMILSVSRYVNKMESDEMLAEEQENEEKLAAATQVLLKEARNFVEQDIEQEKEDLNGKAD